MRRFLSWAQRADPDDRAEAASALARAYLYSELVPATRAEAAVAMTVLLDDPSALVRRALAEALASASEVPRHLLVALASDQSDVAAPVLARSPVLTDAELVDCAAIGDVVAQCALARRPNLGLGVAAALIEIGERDAVLTLIGNLNVDLPAGALRRVFERFGDDAEARDALLARPRLPAALKAEIAIATANHLSGLTTEVKWLARERAKRIAREVRDRTIATIAAACVKEERPELVRRLRECGALTPALLMRSLLSGERDLFAAALAELSGVPVARVDAFMLNLRGEGFAALTRKAGLAIHHLPVYRAALAALAQHGGTRGEGLNLRLVEKVIAACKERDDPALDKTLSLLWRFAAEAARAEARDFARGASSRRRRQSPDFSLAASDQGFASSAATIVIDPFRPTIEARKPVAGQNESDEGVAPPVELPIELKAAREAPGAAARDLSRNLDFSPAANDEGFAQSATMIVIDPPTFDALEWLARLNGAWEDVARRFELSIDLAAALEEPDDSAARRLPQSLDFSRANDEGYAAPAAPILIGPPDATCEAPDSIAALRGEGEVAPPIELSLKLIEALNQAA